MLLRIYNFENDKDQIPIDVVTLSLSYHYNHIITRDVH